MKKALIFSALLTLFHLQVLGQGYKIENFNLEGNLDAWFHSNFDSANTKPMIGALPLVSPPRRMTNVFFMEKSQDWVMADLTYDNHFYGNARLRYDIEKQVIYVLNPLLLQPITLNQNLVNRIDTPIGAFKPRKDAQGYYLILSEGKTFSLIKESSKQSVVEGTEIQYQRLDRYYLLYSDRKEALANTRSLLKKFPEHKKEIKKYMRQRESRMIKIQDKERYLIHIAAFCDVMVTK